VNVLYEALRSYTFSTVEDLETVMSLREFDHKNDDGRSCYDSTVVRLTELQDARKKVAILLHDKVDSVQSGYSQSLRLTGRVAVDNNSTTTVNLGQTLSPAQMSNLPGSWITIGDVSVMTRRIKSVTIDGLATIWATADQATFGDIRAADFAPIPSNNMKYTVWSDSPDCVWVGIEHRFRIGNSREDAITIR
jgi:hypothetical protein